MADKNISYVPPTHGKRVDDKKIEEGEECKYNNSFIKLVSFEFSHQGQNLKKKIVTSIKRSKRQIFFFKWAKLYSNIEKWDYLFKSDFQTFQMML